MKKDERAKHTPEKENICPEEEPVTTESQSPESNGEQNCNAGSEHENITDPQTENDANDADDEEELSPVPGLDEQLEDLKNTHLRVLAEYENYRKRTAREKETYYALAKAEAVEKFLPVYDNIERAVNNHTSDEAYKKGVEMIFQQVKDVFGGLGVTEIEAVGASFDPEKHNAVMHIEDEEYEENSVVEVFQTGFEVDGHVIRHAVVKVAN